jgi:2-amino-4-hydroxy-6-hydroxymethyldihydropteridine diphosphokinase
MTARVARTVYFGIGSNLGDRLAHLQAAVDGLAAAGLGVRGLSAVYETEPVGGPPQPDYLNAVVAVETDLDAGELLALALALEDSEHRERAERWGPRTLDVDVLLVGEEHVSEPDLVVPHPRLLERGFVLAPLRDLDPELVDRLVPGARSAWQGVRRTELRLRHPENP